MPALSELHLKGVRQLPANVETPPIGDSTDMAQQGEFSWDLIANNSQELYLMSGRLADSLNSRAMRSGM